MSTTNFKVFDEGMLNLMSDEDYAAAIQRLRGVVPGLAIPTLHNKLFLQTSIMCKALADFIVSQGYDALDTDVSVLLTALSNSIIKIAQDNVISGKNMWTENAEVSVGDVMYTADGNGPRWAYLLCSITGTTGLTEPIVASNAVVGQTIVDNDVTWTVKSVIETVIEFCTQAEAEAGINNTKASTPLRVAQAIAAKIPRYIVEKYNNGQNWYEVYNDGWVKQGGVSTGTSGTTRTISLLVPFTSIDYHLVVCKASGNNSAFGINWQNKTTATFDVYQYDGSNLAVAWIAEGYKAV